MKKLYSFKLTEEAVAGIDKQVKAGVGKTRTAVLEAVFSGSVEAKPEAKAKAVAPASAPAAPKVIRTVGHALLAVQGLTDRSGSKPLTKPGGKML